MSFSFVFPPFNSSSSPSTFQTSTCVLTLFVYAIFSLDNDPTLKLIASVILNVRAAVASILNASFFFPHPSVVIPNRKQKLVKTTTQIMARHTIRCLIDFTNQSPKVLYALSLSLSSCHWSRNLRMHTSCYLSSCFFTHLQGFLSHNQTEHELTA